MQILLVVATALQIAAVVYCAILLRRHRNAVAPWLCLLGALVSMLVWRIVMTTGITPSPVFNTTIAIWGSVGAVLAMFFFGREIARREHAEAERDRLLASERAARSEAERASRVKDDFMATLSHELRSPLAAMLGWCSIARRGELPADVARAIDTIERNARIQTRLVDDLLDATRMQAGSLHLELGPVALDVPVRAAIEGVGPSAEAKRLRIRYTCAEPAPIVIGDASRLQQIASNLLVNAVKFTPEGRSIDVTVASRHDYAELTVVDEGIGIDPAFKPQLFQRFRQADTGNARRHGGLGLGLSIVSSLVTLHHGEVQATSDGPGQGATFVVRLPLSRTDVVWPPVDAQGRSMSTADPPSAEGIRVILVDDDEFNPNVLVLDISMPGEDGYALIRRIRRLLKADGRFIPAISLTAHARDEDRRHAIDLGFQEHLAKPVNVAELLTTVRRLADERDNHARGQSSLPTIARPISSTS
jgi:signal transduction histidine kinase